MTLNLGREITASFTDSVVWSVATGLLFLAELIFSQDKDGRSASDGCGLSEWKVRNGRVRLWRSSNLSAHLLLSASEQMCEGHFSQ